MFKSIWNTAITDTRPTDVEGVGRLRLEGESIYRWVKNEEQSTALTKGQAVVHTPGNGADYLNFVKQPTTATLMELGGIVMAPSLPAGHYGWIQVFGYNASVSVSGATTGGTDIAPGDYLKCVNAAGHMVRDTTTTPSFQNTVKILEAVETTTTPAPAYKKGFIRCI
jgi:hypothetical protein